MKRIIAVVAVLSATAVAAEPPVIVNRETCLLMVLNLREPDKMRPDVSLYLDGIFVGAVGNNYAASDLSVAFQRACLEDPQMSITTKLAEAQQILDQP